MTRETKVGLVVAVSFLCLVGVVVASRLGRNADKNQSQTVAQSITPQHDGDPKPEHGTKPESEAPKKDPLPKPQEPKSTPSGVVTVGMNTSSPGKQGEPNLFNLPQVPLPPPSHLETSAPPVDPKSKSPADASEKEHKDTLLALQKAKDDADKAVIGAHADKAVDAPPPPAPVAKVDFPPTPPIPGAVPPINKDGGFLVPALAPQQPDPTRAVDPLANHKKATADNPPAVHPSVPPKAEEVGKGNYAVPAVVPPPATPSVSVSPPVPPANPAKEGQDLSPSPPIAPVADSKLKSTEPAPAAGNHQTPPGPLAFNQQSSDPIKSPFDAGVPKPVPAVSVPPIPVKPPSAPLPKVNVIDTETYFCKADDTFDAISTRFFGTSKYSRALLQYNRDHPLANRGNILKDDNPRLQPGQQVFIPPHEFLDTRFASLIDNRPSVPVVPSVAPAISIKAPVSANPASQPAVIPAVATSDAVSAYRVPDQGQMLIEIAQQKLGDRGRWSEIYRLNPSLRPEFPIPGGTEIRLPSTANGP